MNLPCLLPVFAPIHIFNSTGGSEVCYLQCSISCALQMEVMPNLLAKRTFHPVMTKKLVEPGYREAPDSRDPMTIVFVKVRNGRVPRAHLYRVVEHAVCLAQACTQRISLCTACAHMYRQLIACTCCMLLLPLLCALPGVQAGRGGAC